MMVYKQISKKECLLFFSLILITDIIFLNRMDFRANLNGNEIGYAEGFAYVYYKVIKSNMFFVLTIPIFLYLNKVIYVFLYDYKMIIKFNSLTSWWTEVMKNVVVLALSYTVIRNTIVVALVVFEYGIELNISLFIYLFISVLKQFLIFLMLGISMSLIVFITRKIYIGIFILSGIVIAYDFIMIGLRLLDFKLERFIFLMMEKDLFAYSESLFMIGIFLIINWMLYELGEKAVKKFNVYRGNGEK